MAKAEMVETHGPSCRRSRTSAWLMITLALALATGGLFSAWRQDRALASASPPCPVGSVPDWSGKGCMQVQTQPSLSGYGRPSGTSSTLPESGRNGAPALANCNGVPTPIGQPCPGTQPKNTSSPSTGTTQPAITVSLPPPGSSIYVPSTSATQQLQNLLGTWYTGWMAYLAASLNWSDANTSYVAAVLASIPDCFLGNAQACENDIWKQISPWVNVLQAGNSPAQSQPSQTQPDQSQPAPSPQPTDMDGGGS